MKDMKDMLIKLVCERGRDANTLIYLCICNVCTSFLEYGRNALALLKEGEALITADRDAIPSRIHTV